MPRPLLFSAWVIVIVFLMMNVALLLDEYPKLSFDLLRKPIRLNGVLRSFNLWGLLTDETKLKSTSRI